MKASGISLYRLALPLILAAVVISVLLFLLADTVMPHTSARVNEIWEGEVERRQDLNSPLRTDIWFRSRRRC